MDSVSMEVWLFGCAVWCETDRECKSEFVVEMSIACVMMIRSGFRKSVSGIDR